MVQSISITNQTFFLSCLVFLFFLLLLPTQPLMMFGDPDTAWHIAAGDLIRRLGHVPARDPWSFTAGTMPWINTAWAWDVAASYLHQHYGWHGVVMLNSITIAAALAAVFAACFLRAQHGIAAFITVILAMCAMLNINARPFEMSFLLTALLSLLLAQAARGRCSLRWLLLIPPLMALWVNVHGGFLIGFSLLGIYGLAALWQKRWRLAGWLMGVGFASLLACLCNPYGIDIADVTLRLLTSPINQITTEWQPLDFAPRHLLLHLYLLLFLLLAVIRPVYATVGERWSAYFWLCMGIFSIRHINIFIVLSAPLLAMGLRNVMTRKAAAPVLTPAAAALCRYTTQCVASQCGAVMALLLAGVACTAMLTPQAMALYQTQALKPLPDLSPDIAFLKTHYPRARLLNDFGLGGYLIYEGQGAVPVFIDGRMEGAYSREVARDYVAFHTAAKGWESLLDRWHIDGVMLSPYNPAILDRFIARRGWHKVFSSKQSVIFLRERP